MPVEVVEFAVDPDAVEADVATGCVGVEVPCELLPVVPEDPPVVEPDVVGVPVVEVPPELVVPLPVTVDVVPVPPVVLVEEVPVPEAAAVPPPVELPVPTPVPVPLAVPVPVPVALTGVPVEEGVVGTPYVSTPGVVGRLPASVALALCCAGLAIAGEGCGGVVAAGGSEAAAGYVGTAWLEL
jgi:hypothetical protein